MVICIHIGERLHVTIRADPPLSGPICVDKTVNFTCLVFNEESLHQYQYQWSIDGDTPKIGNQSFTLQVTSRSATNVTCEVYAHQNGGTKVQYGANGVTVQPNGKPIIIHCCQFWRDIFHDSRLTYH